jgi:DNA-directed RNA polymerase alpha subunit
MKVATYKELAQYTPKEILSIKGSGRKFLNVVRDMVEERGYKLKEDK